MFNILDSSRHVLGIEHKHLELLMVMFRTRSGGDYAGANLGWKGAVLGVFRTRLSQKEPADEIGLRRTRFIGGY